MPPCLASLPLSSSASAGDSSGGELAEASRRRSAAEAFGSYEAHLAACNRKFNKSGFQRSWDFGLKPAVTSFTGVVCARGPLPPVMAVPVPKMGPSRPTVSSVIQLALGRGRADASWSAHLEKRLQSAIQTKWVSIVLEDP